MVVGPEVPLVARPRRPPRRGRDPGLRPHGRGRAARGLEDVHEAAPPQVRDPHGRRRASSARPAPALAYLRSRPVPIVVKADGLAAGKGVVVASTRAEAEAAVAEMIDGGKFGAGGRQILIEDCLVGEETSILVVVSGRDYVILPTSQDHKRIGDGDTGPNTGGMGAYSPAEVVTPALMAEIERRIVRPSVDAIASEGIDFRGTLFVGIMLTADGPEGARVQHPLRRPRDPGRAAEARDRPARAPLGRGEGRARRASRWQVRPEHAICVVISAKGLPGRVPLGRPDRDPPRPAPGRRRSSTREPRGTPAGASSPSGGRVLGVTATGASLEAAAASAYAACDSIRCASKYYRRDIGARQLRPHVTAPPTAPSFSAAARPCARGPGGGARERPGTGPRLLPGAGAPRRTCPPPPPPGGRAPASSTCASRRPARPRPRPSGPGSSSTSSTRTPIFVLENSVDRRPRSSPRCRATARPA